MLRSAVFHEQDTVETIWLSALWTAWLRRAGSANIHYVSSCHCNQMSLSLPTVMILSALSALFSARLSRLGGMSACQSIKSDGFSRRSHWGTTGSFQFRSLEGSCCYQKGGIVETVRIKLPNSWAVSSPSQRPGCSRLPLLLWQSYGNAQLICAMHPYGPSDSACQDWVALEANL